MIEIEYVLETIYFWQLNINLKFIFDTRTKMVSY